MNAMGENNLQCEMDSSGSIIAVSGVSGDFERFHALLASSLIWRLLYRVNAGTGRPVVSILWLGEMESLVCNFYLSVAARQIVWADPPPEIHSHVCVLVCVSVCVCVCVCVCVYVQWVTRGFGRFHTTSAVLRRLLRFCRFGRFLEFSGQSRAFSEGSAQIWKVQYSFRRLQSSVQRHKVSPELRLVLRSVRRFVSVASESTGFRRSCFQPLSLSQNSIEHYV